MKLRLLTLLLLMPIMASAESVRFTLVVNYDATYSTAYPAGDKPDAGNVLPVWNAIPNPSFVLGVSGTLVLNPIYVSDGNGDTLGIDNETGCSLPTGIAIDQGNDAIDYDGTGSAGTTTGCIFSAEDGAASEVNSSAFSIVIAASESSEADRTVCASGCDHTSFDAAMDAAADGEIIEGRAATAGATFTDNTAVNTANSGAANLLIVTRCRAGDTCLITGSAGAGADAYAVQITGNYHDFGKNITIQGGGLPGESDIGRGVRLTGSNNIIRELYVTKANQHCIYVLQGANNTVINSAGYLCGGLRNAGGTDFGDVIEFQTGATPGLIYGWNGAAMGHAGMQEARNLFIVKFRQENKWDQESNYLDPGDLTHGDRVLALSESMQNTVLQGFVMGPQAQAYDTTGSQVLRIAYQDGKVRRGLIIGQNDTTGAGINTNFGAGDYGASVRAVFLTVTDHRGPCVGFGGNTLATGAFTEARLEIYHSLFWNCIQNPGGGAKNDHMLTFEFCGATCPGAQADQTKCSVYGSYGNAYPEGSTFYYKNRVTGAVTISTVDEMETDCPNDWVGNIEIGDPLFVDDTIPRVTRPVTIFTDSMITTPYANFAPQNANLLNVAGLPGVTKISGAAASATFDVDSSKSFHAGTTQGGVTVPGDTICIEGVGTRVISAIVDANTITTTASVTASDDTKIFLGDDCTPNIGFYQGDGDAFGL